MPPFDRRFLASDQIASAIGEGEVGGKAAGLLRASDLLAGASLDLPDRISVRIPRVVVLTTDAFRAFVAANDLADCWRGDPLDSHLANAFLRAELPASIVGDLRTLIEGERRPLAVRSSSLLEDRAHRPFAGVYATKMIPNSDPDPARRFQALTEAIKLVWASTFFREARAYRETVSLEEEEAMAVVVQEVVGRPHGDRFYPDVSGVARTWNFYPFGSAAREDGVVSLALGLGKHIVDGGVTWTYSPAHPRQPPPFGSTAERARGTQVAFWSVGIGPPPPYDPAAETEYLVSTDLTAADYDGTLAPLASTWDPQSDRLVMGATGSGIPILDFAPLLSGRELDLNAAVRAVMSRCRDAIGHDVEIEFAATLTGSPLSAELRLLQLRSTVVPRDAVDLPRDAVENALVVASPALGHGARTGLRDVLYVKPEAFDRAASRRVAGEVARLNDELAAEGREYVLVGFGRFGSSDPWLGIPVDWAQIRGARVIVETTLPEIMPEPSQGSHFFHNVTSFEVFYLYVREDLDGRVDWDALRAMPAVRETEFVRHVRSERPITAVVDGRAGRGLVYQGDR
ncbi:MAG: hypothetical protein KC591_07435 [Gemmatimonadetes bacterium]|nr:hypothetical protein [Gemmatimonadota bacterium]